MSASWLRLPVVLVLLGGLSACASGGFDVLPLGQEAFVRPALSADSLYKEGKAKFQVGQYGLALSFFRRADALRPGDLHILNAVAATYDQIGRSDLARGYYLRALALAPHDPQTLNNYGYSLLLAGHYEAAGVSLSQAVGHAVTAQQWEIAEANLGLLRERTRIARAEGRPALPERTAADFKIIAHPRQTVMIERTAAKVYRLAFRGEADQPLPPATVSEAKGVLVAARDSGPMPSVREDPLPPVRQRALPLPRSERKVGVAEPADLPPLRIEVSNGAGRLNLAARMSQFLTRNGISVILRTNDRPFTHQRTIIYYRVGQKPGARRIASILPFAVKMQEVPKLVADVKVRLGGDSLDFDRVLIHRFAKNSSGEEKAAS